MSAKFLEEAGIPETENTSKYIVVGSYEDRYFSKGKGVSTQRHKP